jgi:hypothetical protein
MELEGPLPCSQEPSTGPYNNPDQSSPYHPILHLKNSFMQSEIKIDWNTNVITINYKIIDDISTIN